MLDGERWHANSHVQVSLEMLNWVQLWTLAGPLQDFYKFFPKPVLCVLGGMPRVAVLLKTCRLEPEILSPLEFSLWIAL